MKTTTKLLLCTLCAAALLSGCGTAPAQSEGSASSAETARLAESMDRLRTANALETLMDKYTAVTRLNARYQDEDQKEPWDAASGSGCSNTQTRMETLRPAWRATETARVFRPGMQPGQKRIPLNG